MSNNNKRNTGGVGASKKIILGVEIFIILVLLLMIGYRSARKTFIRQTSEKLIESVVKDEAAKYGIDTQDVQQVLDTVSDEDKETVEDIVKNHMDQDVVSESTKYLENGDYEGLKNYVMEELDPEEQQEVLALYEKYKDQF